jgi:Caspase domain
MIEESSGMRTIMRSNFGKDYTVQPFQTQHAFIVGINDYQYVSQLKTAVNDAIQLGKILENDHFHRVHPVCLNPTADELRAFLGGMKAMVGENDSALFYFAGHGIALEDDSGMNGYIVPTDAQVNDGNTLIPMTFLQECFEALPCRHFLLILDCCFAGSIRWATTQRNVDNLFLPKRIYKERFERYLMDKAWQVLASASHNQKAFDSLKGFKNERDTEGDEHSPFALALYDALSGKGDIVPADGGDGIITATELYLYLREQVELPTLAVNMRLRQTPAIFTMPKHDKGEFIFFAPHHRLNLPPIPKSNPFKGLQSFNETDKELFYGRDRVIKQLLDRVMGQSLTVVSGASGTGKSSVVKAGLIPQLREKKYTVLPVIRPTQKPLEVLASVELPENKRRTVFVIDQFEELLTQSNDDDRQGFIKVLRGYITEGLTVIVTVRSDFEPQFETDNWADWHKGRFIVPPFTVDELREAIVRPTVQEVLQFDKPQLIDQILQEVVQSPGALPLLSFTLSELYEKYVTSGRNDRLLMEDDYKSLGGVIGSLRKKADKIYSELDNLHQNSMRNVMLRLVSLSGGEYAGKRIFKTDLAFTNVAETKHVETVVAQMQEARLIVADTDNDGRTYIEPAHDALVRAWTKLTEWVKARGEENVLLQNKLAEAVNDYSILKNKELLWHDDPRLEILRGANNTWMNARESQFIAESIAEQTRRIAKRRRELIIAFSILGLFLVGAIYFAIASNNNAKEATKQSDIAKVNESTAKANETKAINNLKLYKSQEMDRFIIDADTYNKSGHTGYAKAAIDSVQLIKDEYFKDSLPLQKRINSLKQTLK